MRGDDAVLCLQQRVVAFDWLGGDDIDRGAAQLSAVQRVGEILLHHQLPAAVVDQQRSVLHLGDRVLVDHAHRVREGRAMQYHHVALLVERVAVHIGEAFRLEGGILVRVVDDDAHVQRLRYLSGPVPDAAEADDAHRLARKLHQRVVPVAPVDAMLPLALVHRF